MKTETEIKKEIEKTVEHIESLEHLIAQAELGIKMHRKEIDVVSAKLRGLQWCLNNSVPKLIWSWNLPDPNLDNSIEKIIDDVL